jgi:hypothetical protein
MRRSKDESNEAAVLAVLAAAAREAEELLTQELDLEAGSVDEANRRLQLFMRVRQSR